MSRAYNFALIRLPSHPARGELLNVGIAVLGENGIELRCPPKLDKIRAITGAVDPNELKEDILSFADAAASAIKDGKSFGEAIESAFSLSTYQTTHCGVFWAASRDQYEREVGKIIRTLIDPEPAPPKTLRKRETKLKANIRSAFRSEHVLASREDTLEDHRIVSNHKLAEGVVVDFLLKNGAYHVIETVDAVNDGVSVRKAITDIALSALAFEHARIEFGNFLVKPRLVYQASFQLERDISPSLHAAEHQGAELINWESGDQRRAFLVDLARNAEPNRKKGGTQDSYIHASVQSSLKLN
jgi:hypothetical protein